MEAKGTVENKRKKFYGIFVHIICYGNGELGTLSTRDDQRLFLGWRFVSMGKRLYSPRPSSSLDGLASQL
ncbi:hypothetical protein COCOBI_pt-2260 (chloroplast) [Coccomyxa sp. Obi]|nr:hypothetical protein COCOBI_pt-2260 [Coccomyxa sp. Obi]